jgi:hypothetical protein
MGDIKECIINLKGTLLSAEEANDILDDLKDITDEELKANLMKKELALSMKEKIEMAKSIARDKQLAKKLTVDVTQGSKSYTEILGKLGEILWGRNSIDTVRRRYQNQMKNQLADLANLFGSKDGFGGIETGSKMEHKIHAYVENMDDIDISRLHGEGAKANADAILKEIFPGVEEFTEAHRLALALKAYNDWELQFLNSHGIPVKRHKGYVIKRRYDPRIIEKMNAKDPDGWAKFVYERLNVEKTFDRKLTKAQAIQRLTRIANKIDKNAFKAASVMNTDFDGKPRIKRRREFVFKDADASYEIFKELSVKGLADQLEDSQWSSASQAIKTKRLGTNHTKVIEQVNEGIADYVSRLPGKEGIKTKLSAKAEKVSKGKGLVKGVAAVLPGSAKVSWRESLKEMRINQALGELTGENSYVTNGISTVGTALKMTHSIGKLGNTLTVAMLDPVDANRQVFFTNGEVLSGLMAWHKNMFNVIKEMSKKGGPISILKGDFKALQELNSHLALVTHHISTEGSMRIARGDLATDGNISQQIEKSASNVMKIFTMLPQQTGISKTSTAILGAQTFTRMIDKVKGGKKLNPYELDTMKMYDISESEAKFLGEIQRYTGWANESLLTPKQVLHHLTDGGDFKKNLKKAAKMLGVEESQVPAAISNLSGKYGNFLNDFFTRGTPTPELQAKSALFKASGSQAWNVVAGLATQFKDTPFAQLGAYKEMYDKVKRLHSHPDAGVREMIKAVGKPMAAQIGLHTAVGGSMFLMYDAIWSAIMNKESYMEKLASGDSDRQRMALLSIADKTSAVPFLFEAVNNATGSYHDQSVLNTFSNPTWSMIEQMAKASNVNNRTEFKSVLKKNMPNAWMFQLYKNHWME